MLYIANSVKELHMPSLLSIYEDVLLETAKAEYSTLPIGLALENSEQDFKEYISRDFFAKQGALYAFWMEKEQLVCAARLEPYEDGLLLHALHTKKDHRRRGYACSLINALKDYVDQKLYSHVRNSNYASIALHKKLGFTVISWHCVYLDGSVDSNGVTFCML